MKILYIDLSPGIGGSLLSLERLLSRQDRREFEPVVALAACNAAAPRFRALGVPVIAVPTFVPVAQSVTHVDRFKQTAVGQQLRNRGITAHAWRALRAMRNIATRTLPLVWRLYRLIRQARPDLVHVNDAIFVSRPPIAAAWLAGVPAVCHVRSLGRLNRLDRVWGHTVRQFLCVSRWVADDLAAQGIPPKRTQLIYDGLDLRQYIGLPDRQAARTALGLPLDRPIVAVIGRLVPWKGQDLFLAAMRQVADAIPNALGLLVGEAESYSRDFDAELHALAADLALGDAVRFTGYTSDMQKIYAAIDLLAHTSVTPEPFGLVMIEAMASERPVVTPAEGGGLEIVVDREASLVEPVGNRLYSADGETGSYFTPRDPDALAAAIISILRDPTRARAMGVAGQERVRQAFTLECFAAAMKAIYRKGGR